MFQEYIDEVKSDLRDEAAAFHEDYSYIPTQNSFNRKMTVDVASLKTKVIRSGNFILRFGGGKSLYYYCVHALLSDTFCYIDYNNL